MTSERHQTRGTATASSNVLPIAVVLIGVVQVAALLAYGLLLNPPQFMSQGYPSEPTSPRPLRRERDAKAVRREGDPGWAGDPGGRAASVGPSLAWGSR